MATITVTEFDSMPVIPGSLDLVMPVGMFTGNTVFQTPITISSSAISSSAFASTTRFIRVNSGGVVNFSIGPPSLTTASTASARLSANVSEYFGVAPGQIFSCVSGS